MNGRFFAAALLLLFGTVGAAPVPAFTATGTMNVNGTSADGKNGNVTMDVRVLHRGTATRVDILRLNLATNQPDNAAPLPALPKGVISVLIDTGKGTMSLWSTATKTYFQTKLPSPASLVKKTQKTPESAGPFAQIGSALKGMTEYDVFSSSMTLVGDQQVNGHMAHVYHLTTTMQKHTEKAPSQITADLAFADDLSGIPVQMSATFAGGTKANAAIKADLTQISMTAPQPALLKIPAGYKRTTNPMIAVLGTHSGL